MTLKRQNFAIASFALGLGTGIDVSAQTLSLIRCARNRGS
jgi:hypothetical protein